MTKSDKPKGANAKPNKCQAFLHFLYNKEAGTLIGRTGKSWALIFVFYIIFYALLSGFFIGMLAIFLSKFTDSNMPMLTGENNVLRFKAGLNVKPNFVSVYRSSTDKNSTVYSEYKSNLDKYFAKSFPNVDVKNKVDCKNETPTDLKTFCKFDKKDLGKCSDGLKESLNGRLCLYIQLNKIFGWLPDINNSTISQDILITCTGQNPGDVEILGNPEFFPSLSNNKTIGVISNKYFPYANQKNYTSPMVAFQFPNMWLNMVILVECRMINVVNKYNNLKFEIMMENLPVTKP